MKKQKKVKQLKKQKKKFTERIGTQVKYRCKVVREKDLLIGKININFSL